MWSRLEANEFHEPIWLSFSVGSFSLCAILCNMFGAAAETKPDSLCESVDSSQNPSKRRGQPVEILAYRIHKDF